MRISKTLPAIMFGLALSLGACSGSEDGDEATEEAEETSGDPASHEDRFTDQTGEFAQTVGEEAVANINARLASKHSEGGNDIHVLVVDSTNNEDTDVAAAAARAETDADALILIAAGDQDVAVVGENIDESEAEGAASAIITAFDNNNFENGILNGIMAVEMHMDE